MNLVCNTNKNIQNIKSTVKFTIVLYLLSVFFSCQKSDLNKVSSKDMEGLPFETSYDITWYYSDNGILKFELQSPQVDRYIDTLNPRREFPKGVTAFFYDSSGNLNSTLKAKFAISKDNTAKADIVLKDSVIFKNYKKETLRTDLLYLRNDSVYTDQRVTITNPTSTIIAKGLIANQDFTFYRLFNIIGQTYIKGE